MKIAHRLACGALTAMFALAPLQAQANEWPAGKPIKIIVPYAAGGFADTRVRMLGQALAKVLETTVVVENKAGAGGVIGTAEIARSKPDGYTIGTGNLAPLSVNPTLMPKNVTYNVKKIGRASCRESVES